MTSTSIYTPIKPTYLYIKQHSITGLKYFGKTTQNPYTYPGSGTYWKKHIKTHGKKHIETIWVSEPYTDTSIVEIALHFSKENNIVNSKKWANLIFENGLDGGHIGKHTEESIFKMSNTKKGKPFSEQHKTNISAAKKGKKTKPRSSETKLKISITKTNKPRTEETKAKISIAHKGKTLSEEHKIKISNSGKNIIQKQLTCPHCNKTGRNSNINRYHFDNCKLNLIK